MKERAGIFALMISSMLLAFLLAEILVRIFIPQDNFTTWIEVHPRGFMMNQTGVEAYQNFKNRQITYRLNGHGLRGDEISSAKDEKRVLLLGDSFTFGLILHEEETFAAQLQDKANQQFRDQNIRIINGGVGGAGLADWPLWLDHIGEKISPDIVIFYLNGYDADRAVSKNLFVLDKTDSTLVESLRWKPNESMFKLGRKNWYRWIQKHSELANILVGLAWRHLYFSDVTDNFNQENSAKPVPAIADLYAESDYSLLLSKKLLQRLDQWCELNGCRFILTTTGYFETESVEPHTKKFYRKLKEIPPENIQFFDNTSCLHDLAGGDLQSITIPDDGHPNEKGAAYIAKCSWQWLAQILNPEKTSL